MLGKTFNPEEMKRQALIIEEVIAMYQGGNSMESIAIHLKLTIPTVRKILMDNNIAIRQKNNKGI